MTITGLSSNQGEKSVNFYFISVPLKKVLKYGTPKLGPLGFEAQPKTVRTARLTWPSRRYRSLLIAALMQLYYS